MESQDKGERLQRLIRYATCIKETFGPNTFMTTLSGTGIDLQSSLRRPQQLAQTVEKRDEEGKNHDERQAPAFQTIHHDDIQFLRGWASHANRPALLVSAPFGYGKSALLGQFAYVMAEDMLAILKAGDPDHPALRIPIPVRLRDITEDWTRRLPDWAHMLALAPRVIRQSIPNDALLPIDDIRRLADHAHRPLVCLYDGHDEIGSRGGDVLRDIDVFHGGSGYMVSSRATAKMLGGRFIEVSQCLELQDLPPAAMSAIFNQLFGTTGDKRQRIDERFRALQPSIGLLVRRPLFLAAWVQEAIRSDSDIAQLPSTVDELMEVVSLECFTKAGLTDFADHKSRVHTFPALGYHLLADAEASFDDIPRPEAERAALRERWSVPAPAGYDAAQTELLAIKLGVLSSRAGKASAGKIPVTEYLVGRYLAAVAAGPDAGQRAFVELVRRWCYRPQTHDTLDYTVQRLAGRSTSRLIESLIQWMCDFSKEDPFWKTATESIDKPIAENLLRTVTVLAFRWADRTLPAATSPLFVHLLNTTPIQPALTELTTAIRRPELVVALFRQAIQSCIAEAGQAPSDWAKAIREAAGHLDGTAAALLVPELLRSYEKVSGSDKPQWTWAVKAASERVAGVAAAEVVCELLQAYHSVSSKTRLVWGWTIETIAGRVNRAVALSLVRKLVKWYTGVSHIDQPIWASAISAATARVNETEITTVVLELLQSYADASEADKSAWVSIIKASTRQVRGSAAVHLVREVLKAHANAAYKDELVWASTINVAASNAGTREDAVHIARMLIEAGWFNLASKIASLSEDLRPRGETSKGNDDQERVPERYAGAGETALAPLQNDERFILDEGLVAVPREIAELLRPFREQDGADAAEQSRMIEAAVLRLRPDFKKKGGFPNKPGDWRTSIIDRGKAIGMIDAQHDIVTRPYQHGQRWLTAVYVRREALSRLLKNDAFLEQFLDTRHQP